MDERIKCLKIPSICGGSTNTAADGDKMVCTLDPQHEMQPLLHL